MILTVDLGTTTTKAALWSGTGMVAMGRSRLETHHPAPSWAEQDASAWWPSVLSAVRAVGPCADVDALCFSGARRTFVPVAADGEPVGPALLWSDTRAASGAVPAKLEWLRAHVPERLDACRWLLAPRDLIVWRATGEVRTDWTLASASGAYDDDGSLVEEAQPYAAKLPAPVPSSTVVGQVRPAAAAELGIPARVPVVIGAGDRQCEALGTGASTAMPMVSWGTTANTSTPLPERPPRVAAGLRLTRGALGGWLVEGGVSAAGSLLQWLGRLTGAPVETLVAEAQASVPGGRGVVALPWLGGARAPWWREDVGAAFVGLGPGNTRGDLARAAVDGVAIEILRCIDVSAARRLVLAGSGATSPLWVEVLGGVTGLPVVIRRSGEAASAGAALVAAAALGAPLEVEAINPPIDEHAPDPEAVAAYALVRRRSDAAARALLDG